MRRFARNSGDALRMRPTQPLGYVIGCVLSLLFLGGCVPNRAYRADVATFKQPASPELTSRPGDDDTVPKQTALELPSTVRPISVEDCSGTPSTGCFDLNGKRQPRKFYLAYIEFDDMGELWSIGNLNLHRPQITSQLDEALAVIDEAKQEAKSSGRPLDVVTFIHGWHNNASPYDEDHNKNLARFKTDMQLVATNPSATDGKTPVVVGVFIAWRGQTLTGDPFLTYWNRRNAATRIGGSSMTEVLFKLMFETKGVLLPPDQTVGKDPLHPRNPCQPSAQDKDAHFVAIGHSFGARVLEHAMSQPLLAMLLEQKTEVDACIKEWKASDANKGKTLITPTLESPADLIVLLNPANDAFETKSMIEAFKRSGLTMRREDAPPGLTPAFSHPVLVSMTSKGDWATRKVMPVAQRLSSAGFTFRKYDDGRCSEGQLDLHYQTSFLRQSDGNIGQMHSYEVKPRQARPGDVSTEACNGPMHFKANAGGQEKCFMIERKEETETKRPECYLEQESRLWNNTPFWVIGVDEKVIPNHTDIFQPGTISLLMAIAKQWNVPAAKQTMSAQASSTAPEPVQ